MGTSQVNLFFDNIFIKDTGTSAITPWHHDLPYTPMAGEMFSLWLALSPVPRRDSPRYVVGSHQWGRELRPRSFFDPEKDYDASQFVSSKLAPMPDIDSQPDRYNILSWEMKPGDIQAFDGLTVHSAPGNTSGQARRTFVTRWAAEGSTYADRGPECYPSFPNCGLKPGDPLDSVTFPILWRANSV